MADMRTLDTVSRTPAGFMLGAGALRTFRQLAMTYAGRGRVRADGKSVDRLLI
jgi:hypothetical protein